MIFEVTNCDFKLNGGSNLMIYITGDCHGNFERFNKSIFPEQEEMTKDDFVIICGDFGGVWHKDAERDQETMILDCLECKPFTTLFVCGNHENFDRLYSYPVEEWNGGKKNCHPKKKWKRDERIWRRIKISWISLCHIAVHPVHLRY